MTAGRAETTWATLEAARSDPVGAFAPSTLEGLPEPAQRLLRTALPAATPLVGAVEIEMRGEIELVGRWLPFHARQILRAGVGFVWAPVVGGRIIRFVGADSLGPAGAGMEFRLHGRIPVVRASGPDIVRSAAGRLAAETVAWLPHALTPQAGAVWRPLDADRATVSLPGPSGPIDVDVTVDDAGDLAGIELQRWNSSAKPPAFAPFGGAITDNFDVGGVRIAGRGSVGWDRGMPTEQDGVFFRYDVTSARFTG